MPFGFSDIYKPIKDLMTKNLNGGKNALEVRTKTASGSVFVANTTLGGKPAGDITFEFPLQIYTPIKFKSQSWIDGKLKTTATATELVPNLKLEGTATVSSDPTFNDEFEMFAEYQCPRSATSLKTLYRAGVPGLAFVAMTTFKFRDFFFGGSLDFDSTFKNLAGYGLGFRYAGSDHVIAGVLNKAKGTLGVTHTVQPGSTLGLEYELDIAKQETAVSIAGETKLSDDVVAKGRVTTRGDLAASMQYQLNQYLKTTFSAETNVKNGAPVTWGLVFNYEH